MHLPLRSLGLAASAAALLLSASPALADEAPVVPLDPPVQLAPEEMMEIYGWFMGQRLGMRELGFSADELAAFSRGLEKARSGQPSLKPFDSVRDQIGAFLEAKQKAYTTAQAEASKGAQNAHFAILDQNPAILKTPSGLRYEIIAAGEGTPPVATDRVKVNYTGRLLDGTVFDTSEGRGPAEFGLNQVIPGWTEGMQLVGEGGMIELEIPSELGYGARGAGGVIPPNAKLHFLVETLKVK